MKIVVEVDGRPPRKKKKGSIWGDDWEYTLKLRQAVLKQMRAQGITGPHEGWVGITLRVYAPNINRADHEYVGDIDAFVSGVCDAIQSAHPNVRNPSPIFKKHGSVGPDVPLVIRDDMQVREIYAKKIEESNEDKEGRYVLIIRLVGYKSGT